MKRIKTFVSLQSETYTKMLVKLAAVPDTEVPKRL